MHLAFIDSLQVGGGLSRFSLLLCKGLIDNHPEIHIDYYIHYDNLKHIPEIDSLDDRVDVKVLESTKPKNLFFLIFQKLLSKLWKPNNNIDKVLAEIECKIGNNYDLAYFPSAHMMKRPRLKIPVVGTIHDFNWKYFFGRQIFSQSFVEMMDTEILHWMSNGLNICSSADVVNEANILYPNIKNNLEVIPIAPVVVHTGISKERAEYILTKLKIDFPYLIFPGNFFPHKNHLNLFTAFSILKQRKGFENYKLVLTGMNSEQVSRSIATQRGLQLTTKNSSVVQFDVIGMGYQPNEFIEALIFKAKLLVSPSIYEAICTPAMDAWHFGTPTAISDIPPFREHEKTWGIKSAFFNPLSPQNIADVIENYLSDYEKAMEDGKLSKIKMAEYTWKNVAQAYLEVFKKAIGNK